MGSQQSDQEFHCPECGALVAVGADHCSKCRREFLPTRAAAGSPAKPASSILKTLGILAIIVVAASAAFFATCIGSGIALWQGQRGGSNYAPPLFFGGLAAIAVAYGLAWLFWLRPRKTNRPRQ